MLNIILNRQCFYVPLIFHDISHKNYYFIFYLNIGVLLITLQIQINIDYYLYLMKLKS